MKFLIVAITTFLLTGCFEKKHEFLESEFTASLQLLCVKDHKSSPLEANSFIVHYNKELEIGNLGQLVYSLGKVEVAYVYETDSAYITDNDVSLYLEPLDQDTLLPNRSIEIDRKNLSVKMDSFRMKCEKIDSKKQLESKKRELEKQHLDYKAEQKRLNLI